MGVKIANLNVKNYFFKYIDLLSIYRYMEFYSKWTRRGPRCCCLEVDPDALPMTSARTSKQLATQPATIPQPWDPDASSTGPSDQSTDVDKRACHAHCWTSTRRERPRRTAVVLDKGPDASSSGPRRRRTPTPPVQATQPVYRRGCMSPPCSLPDYYL